jgi:hypothetical protein
MNFFRQHRMNAGLIRFRREEGAGAVGDIQQLVAGGTDASECWLSGVT